MTKKYLLPELKQMIKDNKIKGITIVNKPEILKFLIERGLVPVEALAKPVKSVKENDPKYEHFRLKLLCNNLRKVIIKDLKTGIETEYPSIYRTSQTFGWSTRINLNNNDKVWKGRYEIKVV